ncbi:adenosine kinase [Desulfonema magnum]|uniref:PfkB family carbohydrate kinase n=1 Tax=Desulfonema magnum TaxID=45655 RepID=A0A975GMA9_9BACT|nr:adenosine kinase [Desulfonema magnum]QTA86489.1 PfkB family carbohydrate kinase [Desulfonema magnum]
MLTTEKGDESRRIVGIGSALVDILVHEDDEFLEKATALKGGMTYVEDEFIEQVMTQANGKLHVVPGGSACNTIIGVGKLGGAARFVGKLGEDKMGKLFEKDLRNNNVEPMLFTSSSPTGRVLSIITPDAQRSMLTYLGASAETHVNEITEKCFQNTAIVHIEGYLLFNKDVMLAALNAAKRAGTRVSLDLASFTVVESSKDFLETLVDDFVDILIANEDEARAFTGYADETDALGALSEKAEIAVLKVGERGSFISREGNVTAVEPKGGETADVVDTTGAGDLWASGFLFGLANDYPIDKCGELGSMCGYEVCRVMGANIPEAGWKRIRKLL